MSSCTAQRRGFTLLELVLVLMVLAVVLAAAAPSLSGWNRGQKLQNAADGVLSAALWARAEAVATAAPHRLEVDPMTGVYRVTRRDGEDWVASTGEFARDTTLSPGLSIEIVRQDESGTPAIDFHPNGRISPARIELAAEWGELITLEAAGAAESLRIVRPAGGA